MSGEERKVVEKYLESTGYHEPNCWEMRAIVQMLYELHNELVASKEEKNAWHTVSSSMNDWEDFVPDGHVEVLAKDTNGIVFDAYLDTDWEWKRSEDSSELFNVIAWKEK